MMSKLYVFSTCRMKLLVISISYIFYPLEAELTLVNITWIIISTNVTIFFNLYGSFSEMNQSTLLNKSLNFVHQWPNIYIDRVDLIIMEKTKSTQCLPFSILTLSMNGSHHSLGCLSFSKCLTSVIWVVSSGFIFSYFALFLFVLRALIVGFYLGVFGFKSHLVSR